MKVWEQITPYNWAKGWFAYDDKHKTVGYKNPKAVCWCSIGWLQKVYGADCYEQQTQLMNCAEIPPDGVLGAWNDGPDRTFQEVYEAFKKADL